MPRTWLPVVALAGLTAACASVAPPAPPASPPPAPAAPAPVVGYDWFLSEDGDAARLAYGVEASDELKLGLDCQAGTGRVALVANGPTGADEIHLESGGETERFRASGEPSGLNEGDLLTAPARTDAPVLLRFRRLGWIAQWTEGRREAYAPHPGSATRVERFFAVCG